MFCHQCGNSIAPGARFCSNCGAANTLVPPPAAGAPSRQLVRPRHPRLIAGVCAAFANAYGWDLSVVRVVTALIIVLTGVGILAYIAAWIFIPEAPYELMSGTAS